MDIVRGTWTANAVLKSPMNDAAVQKLLGKIDWDFPDSHSNYGLHSLHWYPGTFIPQIPAYLIELFSERGDVVLDCFCGIGTTLVEAVRLGRNAIGMDVNPIATMVAQAKLTFFEPGNLRRLSVAAEEQLDVLCLRYGLHGDSDLFRRIRRAHTLKNEGEFEVLKPWYHAETWREMLAIRELVDQQCEPFRRVCESVFSSIAKACSSQREHWGYVADNMIPRSLIYYDAVNAFRFGLRTNVDAFERFLETPNLKDRTVSELNTAARVLTVNCQDMGEIEDQSVDLIVTSPPYLSVTDYMKSQRLSLWWSRYSVEALREIEIGARFKRTRTKAFDDYLEGMTKSISNMARVLKSDHYLCLVIGETEVQRKSHQLIDRLRNIVLEQGFCEPFGKIQRTRTRERLKSRQGAANDEYILVFRKA